jgi:hypothetical protein
MHIRPRDPMRQSTPGPGAYTPTDSNRARGASYTLKSRHESVERPNTAPYRDIGSTVGAGPKISLSSRHKVRVGDDTPGPSYVPPNLGTDAQKSALSSRRAEPRDSRADNPGPGAYSIAPKFANEGTKSTLHQRTSGGGPDHCSPGPAAYSPDYWAAKPRSPSASLHIRPKDLQRDPTPGPPDYQVSRDLGGLRSTMHIRPRDLMRQSTPGPGAYTPTDSNRARGASYTLKSRHESVERPNTAPYRDIGSTVGAGPKISLSSRHKVRVGDDTPGPSYVPPDLGADAQKSALSSRYADARDPRADNPGPGAYSIAPKFANEGAKSTLHQRTSGGGPDHCSPGPAAYSPDYGAAQPRSPSASLHIRPKDPSRDQTPGYVDLGSTFSSRGWTIGLREPLDLIVVHPV